jgi:hypothetical protein
MVPIYASCITEMTDMRHHPQLVGSDGGLDNLYLDWRQTLILLISTSQVARIITMSQRTQPKLGFLGVRLPEYLRRVPWG